jgi:threonine aldolase
MGAPDPGAVAARIRGRDLHSPATALICVENAHSCGRVASRESLSAIRSLADGRGLPVHMDGARLFNAAVASGVPAAELAAPADSVMVCLSKGLCAPAGSLLAGRREFVDEARMRRKIMGGGMRQIGILAAAGIVALETHVGLLADDHGRARALERGLSEIPGVSVDGGGEINLVFFSCPRARDGAAAARVAEFFASRGVLVNGPEDGVFRFATHHWIGDDEIGTILAVSREAFREGGALGSS